MKMEKGDEEIILDRLCACQSFMTPITGWHTHRDPFCDNMKTSFFSRWTNLPFSKKPLRKEWNKDGVVFQVWKKKEYGSKILLIAFRHQEGESLWDSDQWEGMSLCKPISF